jgi:hypothetical protein
VNLRVAPCVASDSTQMRPALAFNYLPTLCQPNACTGNFLSVQTLEHPNTSLASAGSIPMPLSLTANSHPSAVLSAETSIMGAALPLYLMELPSRFWKICFSIASLATTVGNGSEVTVAPLVELPCGAIAASG